MKRYLEKWISADLKEKMVFLGGPRQVGKTTLSFDLLGGNEKHPGYLNWDLPARQKELLNSELPYGQPLIVLDEIHKFKGWRNLVKGLFDTNRSTIQFLITGSARLDFYRRGGDSLQGRYHYQRLHPFSLFELNNDPAAEDLDQLLEFGGFPEPFLKCSKRHWKRWQRERSTRVIQDDLISLEHVREISQLGLMISILPARVGSPLSVNNLKQDLKVAFETVERWLRILENLYYIYRVQPYGVSGLRAAKKEKKLYFWDWSLCESPGSRFENFVASQLLKYCHFHEDNEGDKMELRFLRDSEKREIDFIVLKNDQPLFAVECKVGEKSLSKHVAYFSRRTEIPLFYQVHSGTKDIEIRDLRSRILPFPVFCRDILRI